MGTLLVLRPISAGTAEVEVDNNGRSAPSAAGGQGQAQRVDFETIAGARAMAGMQHSSCSDATGGDALACECFTIPAHCGKPPKATATKEDRLSAGAYLFNRGEMGFGFGGDADTGSATCRQFHLTPRQARGYFRPGGAFGLDGRVEVRAIPGDNSGPGRAHRTVPCLSVAVVKMVARHA